MDIVVMENNVLMLMNVRIEMITERFNKNDQFVFVKLSWYHQKFSRFLTIPYSKNILRDSWSIESNILKSLWSWIQDNIMVFCINTLDLLVWVHFRINSIIIYSKLKLNNLAQNKSTEFLSFIINDNSLFGQINLL